MTRRGLFLPPFDVFADPGRVADLAVEAENAGWDGVFVWDHLLYAEPVVEIADPWICCAVIAERTSRIAFGPMVTPLARRRPQVVARQAVSLDRLSGGRLILGFGLGDDGPGELSGFGEETNAKVRAAVLDEGLEVLRGLLSGTAVHHDGPQVVARDVTFLPPPHRSTGIPFWIGGRWPNKAPMRRAARHEGLFVIAVEKPAELTGARDFVAGARAMAGGSISGFDLVVQLPPGEDHRPWIEAGATWVLTQLGPYRMDLDEVREIVRKGP